MAHKIGILGTGIVGKTLAQGFIRFGNEVMIGAREAGKAADIARDIDPLAKSGTFAQTTQFGELVVLAVKGGVAESVIDGLGAAALANKLVIDTTNPIADSAPVHGVLQFFTGPNDSLLERLQRKAPQALFVKAFSCVGSPFMVQPNFPAGPPTMFICGNDATAKSKVSDVLKAFGWDVADMGAVEAARAIEPLCQLWCIPGLSQGSWTHAFRLLRQ